MSRLVLSLGIGGASIAAAKFLLGWPWVAAVLLGLAIADIVGPSILAAKFCSVTATGIGLAAYYGFGLSPWVAVAIAFGCGAAAWLTVTICFPATPTKTAEDVDFEEWLEWVHRHHPDMSEEAAVAFARHEAELMKTHEMVSLPDGSIGMRPR